MDNPPVNALGHALRVGLEKAFSEANADAGIKAIVLTGTGRFFSAGADITEFKGEMKEPLLPALIDTIETSTKPVVAAVNGTALGGGLELALGCHYRVSTKDVRQLGLPEIKLGLIPGYGGTQRLSRIAGPGVAREWVLTGEIFSAEEAHRVGVVNRLFAPEALKEGTQKLMSTLLSRSPVALLLAIETIALVLNMSQQEVEVIE
ncbi:MAG: enoyl-CoA hydratase/isomerase family protein, partial [Pseudomonadota bacterium]|nr:enoyl-CoA hydratase/isomerase family protein [Pseudomonadota bacterium]